MNRINSEIILQVSDVQKRFKDVIAVDKISLSIHKGEYTALLGPNGAGKTTLMEMIEGIQVPDSGDIQIKGMNWRTHQEKLHRMIGISLQETRFIDKLTVVETLRLFASFYGLHDKHIFEVMELVNLDFKKKSYVVNLSGGQRQKLSLGIALLNDPEFLLLDEPTTGLDPTARREIWDILLHFKKEKNTTLILTTHYMEEAESLCERIIIMDKGKILAEATLEKLLKEYAKGETIEFSIEGECRNLQLSGISVEHKLIWDENTNKGKILVDNIAAFLPRFLEQLKTQNMTLKTLECHGKTLDDLFISMTGRHLTD